METEVMIISPIDQAKQTKGSFGLREEGGGMEWSRVELAENRLILGQLYSTLLPLPSLNPNGP